jgi:hypothetical protein
LSLPNNRLMGVIKMVLQDCYEVSVEVLKQKFVPLMQSWGLKVAEEESGWGYICRLSNPENNRHLSLAVERRPGFILLHGKTGKLGIYPESILTEEGLRERVWKFFRRSMEHFVTELVWLHAPRYWQRKGRRIFRRRKSELLDLTFSLGKRIWKWEIEQVIYPDIGYPELRKLGIVRCPAHQDPVAAGLGIISAEGLIYL